MIEGGGAEGWRDVSALGRQSPVVSTLESIISDIRGLRTNRSAGEVQIAQKLTAIDSFVNSIDSGALSPAEIALLHKLSRDLGPSKFLSKSSISGGWTTSKKVKDVGLKSGITKGLSHFNGSKALRDKVKDIQDAIERMAGKPEKKLGRLGTLKKQLSRRDSSSSSSSSSMGSSLARNLPGRSSRATHGRSDSGSSTSSSSSGSGGRFLGFGGSNRGHTRVSSLDPTEQNEATLARQAGRFWERQSPARLGRRRGAGSPSSRANQSSPSQIDDPSGSGARRTAWDEPEHKGEGKDDN